MKPSSFLLAVLLSIIIFGCQKRAVTPSEEGKNPMTLKLTSSAFQGEGSIPKKYTCDGENISPDLLWGDLPQGVKSLALIVDDPDAPAGTWVHWVLFNIPPAQTNLKEGVHGVGVEGVNDFRKLGYGGPCPPKGKPHRYYFKLYALDAFLGNESGARKNELEKAMAGHILAEGQLMGNYER